MINRQAVYDKFKGHCAYCGKVLLITDMQVDHIIPKYHGGTDEINNLYPACRRCNHYKRAHPLSLFRKLMLTLHKRIQDIYVVKVAIDYNIISITPFTEFYFEKFEKEEKNE